LSGEGQTEGKEWVNNPTRRFSVLTLVIMLALGIIVGGGLGYVTLSTQITHLQQQVQFLQTEIQTQPNYAGAVSMTDGNVSLSQLYQSVKDSVVMIAGTVVTRTLFGTATAQVQGSGFVYSLPDRPVVITNFHVVVGASNIVVTFADGDAYKASVLGSDPYSDLAVLSVDAPPYEFKPIPVVSSDGLRVGDPVMAIGSPFGLTGSVTTGIVSQLGRTIQESTAGGYTIADVIQISAAINPGNSGGPLLNYLGQVIGITTATVSGSEGLGFAISSSTILREVVQLADVGKYTAHPWLGASGVDMNYDISKAMGVNVTYGWLIQSLVSGGPADIAGLRAGNQRAEVAGNTVMLGGDIIIAMNGTRIVNGDDLSSYLERYTLPGQSLDLTIVRNGQVIEVTVTLGARPPLSS